MFALKPLFKTSGIYIGTNILAKGLLFFLIPILTRYLSPGDYGILAMFEAMLAVSLPIVGLSLNGFISVKYYDVDKENISEYIGNVLFIIFSNFIIVYLAIHTFKYSISEFVDIPANWLYLIPMVALGQCISEIVLVIWQVRTRAYSYGVYRLLQIGIDIIISLYLIIAIGMNWEGRLYGIGATAIIFGIIAIYILFNNNLLSFKLNISYIKETLFFGIPLIPHTIGAWAMNMIDRVLLTRMVGIESTGIYTVGSQIGMIILLITSSFNLAYAPFLFEKLKQSKFNPLIKMKLVKLTYIYNVLILVVAIILGLFAPWFLGSFVGKSFISASSYVMWIAVGYAFHGMYLMVANYIFYAKKTYILAWITFLVAIFNIVSTYILIKYNGAIGAAQATLFTFFIYFILTWILSNNVYKMPWFIRGHHE